MPALHSRQAITVKYSTSRITGGARWTATAAGGRVSVGRDYGLNDAEDAARAAAALCAKLGWSGTYALGTVKNGDHVFVAVDTDSIVQFTGRGHEAPVAKRNRAGGSKRGSKRGARKSPRRSNRCGY